MEKPKVQLVGMDGNIFVVMGAARRALKKAGQNIQADEMTKRITESAENYDHALRIVMEYVDAE